MNSTIAALYRQPLALLTDLYELTMAYGYWCLGRGNQEAVFHLFFRKSPFGTGYAVAAGMGLVRDLLGDFHFSPADVDYLATLRGNDEGRLFSADFLHYLAQLKLTCDIDTVPEGTLVFPQEPFLRVRGPVLQGQLLESVLLNLVNFSTLIATKSARVCSAAGPAAVLEFGLRRAQGIDGAITASRAAYIGGCAATSNVLAGKLYGIPVRGTHAHSWVMCFDDELEAFEAYAQAMPNNCVFLVDTYNSLDGVRHAIKVGQQLRQRGHKLVGVRLDSGDLAYLSHQARRLLDEADFADAAIIASNDLDEWLIENLQHQGAQIDIWGVGTKLATAYDQPALGGVYKLGAIRDADGTWRPKIKVSEQAVKSTIPGVLQLRRFENAEGFVADAIYDEELGWDPRKTIVDPLDATRQRELSRRLNFHDLLVPLIRGGTAAGPPESLEMIRDRVQSGLGKLHSSVRRFAHPHEFPVGLDIGLHERRFAMISAARAATAAPPQGAPSRRMED